MEGTPSSFSSPKRKPDTVLVWSIEENEQQKGGLPREFTFVFLLERPNRPNPEDQVANAGRKELTPASRPNFDLDTNPDQRNETSVNIRSILHRTFRRSFTKMTRTILSKARSASDEVAYTRSTTAEVQSFTASCELPINDAPLVVTKTITTTTTPPKNTTADDLNPDNPADIFTPIHLHITVRPCITNAPDVHRGLDGGIDGAVVQGQVGQRFSSGMNCEDDDGGGVRGVKDGCGNGSGMLEELYNFAELPGNFEDLVELPGSSVGSVVSYSFLFLPLLFLSFLCWIIFWQGRKVMADSKSADL